MHPIICQIGPFTIYSYGVMMALAVMICAFFLSKDAQGLKIKPEVIFDLVFWVVVAGILGARIFYVILNPDYFWGQPFEIIQIQKGGLSWQGGLALGIVAGILYTRKHSLELGKTLDLVAPYIALGHSIGRIGCFLNGCCYGKEVSWGIYSPVYNAHLHPTQFYECVMLFLVFLILKKYRNHNQIPGNVFITYLILASLERFIVEFFRGDHSNTFWGLSVFQWVSLLFILVAIYARSVNKSRSRK